MNCLINGFLDVQEGPDISNSNLAAKVTEEPLRQEPLNFEPIRKVTDMRKDKLEDWIDAGSGPGWLVKLEFLNFKFTGMNQERLHMTH